MVFQYPEYQLFADTVEKDIAFGPKNLKLSQDEIKNRVRKAMEAVGLDYDKYKDRSPFDLSGGQKRRVAIAGVLAMMPKVLILDEPTAGLDPNASHEMNKLIQELHQQGKSILISSHILQDMDDICTNVAIMESGRLIYDRQLESSYIIETSIVPDKLFTQLAQKFSLSSNQERTLIHAKTDREGVAALIGALTANSVLVYEAVHSNVKDVVQEQLHMNN